MGNELKRELFKAAFLGFGGGGSETKAALPPGTKGTVNRQGRQLASGTRWNPETGHYDSIDNTANMSFSDKGGISGMLKRAPGAIVDAGYDWFVSPFVHLAAGAAKAPASLYHGIKDNWSTKTHQQALERRKHTAKIQHATPESIRQGWRQDSPNGSFGEGSDMANIGADAANAGIDVLNAWRGV